MQAVLQKLVQRPLPKTSVTVAERDRGLVWLMSKSQWCLGLSLSPGFSEDQPEPRGGDSWESPMKEEGRELLLYLVDQ